MKFVRVFVALALLAGMIYLVGAGELLQVLARLEPKYVVALICLSVVLIWLSCVKWRLFIRAWGHDAPIIELMKIYTVTYFYNAFAPSFLMGDLARSYHLGKHLENQKDAFVVTFLERVTGLLAMVLLGTVFVAAGAKATGGVELAILSVAFLTIVGALICFSERAFFLFTHLVLGFLRMLKLKSLSKRLEQLFSQISKAVEVGRNNEKLFFNAMFWSICFHLGTVVNTYTAARAIGWQNPDFGGLCIVVPLVLLVAIAPITPSGIGIQEGAFMFFLQRIGASRPEALGVALVLRAKNLITALFGWMLWTSMRSKKPVEVMPTAQSEEHMRADKLRENCK